MALFGRDNHDELPLPDERDMAADLHERVAQAFGPIWRAQENRDPELMRPYVSDGYLERSRKHFDELDRNVQIHCIEDDELEDVAVVQPRGEGLIESAEAYLAFYVRHSTMDLRTGAGIAGDAVARRAW